jgi:hypothetical protein
VLHVPRRLCQKAAMGDDDLSGWLHRQTAGAHTRQRVSKIWTDFEHGNRTLIHQINVPRTPFTVCGSKVT